MADLILENLETIDLKAPKRRSKIPHPDQSACRAQPVVQQMAFHVFGENDHDVDRNLPAFVHRRSDARDPVSLYEDAAAVQIVPIFRSERAELIERHNARFE